MLDRAWISRLAILVIAVVVAVSASDVANAKKSTKNKGGRIFVTYDLAAGAISAPIEIPVEQAVQVAGVCTTTGFRGVGQATVLRVTDDEALLEWVGLDSPFAARITSGFSADPGTTIVFIDWMHTVSVEVNDASSFRIHNASNGHKTGNVTVAW
jgi:hypothetical protein